MNAEQLQQKVIYKCNAIEFTVNEVECLKSLLYDDINRQRKLLKKEYGHLWFKRDYPLIDVAEEAIDFSRYLIDKLEVALIKGKNDPRANPKMAC